MYRWACIPLKAVTKVKLYLLRSLCSLENSGHLNSSENGYSGERKGSVQQWIWCRVPRAAHCRESPRKAPAALPPSARSGKHVTEPFPMFSLRKSSTITWHPVLPNIHIWFLKVKELAVYFILLTMTEKCRECGRILLCLLFDVYCDLENLKEKYQM